MSENEKDNNNFEFIKEQVIVKKRKKIKKWLFPPIITIFLAILFGLIAAVTFILAEPRLYQLLHKEEDTKTPVSFPTVYPEDTETNDGTDTEGDENSAEVTAVPTSAPVVVQQSIAADLDDYLSMNNEIRNVAYNVNKSILNIVSTFSVKDLFGKTVVKTVNTTGVVVYNNSKELLVLVSLDRVENAKSIQIELSDSISVAATLQDCESELNLAIIAVAIEDIPETFMNSLQAASLGESFTVIVGEPILALGSPNGQAGSMEVGIVTSKGSYASITDNKIELFNTSITDNDYSDGIIVNLQGNVIGLITRTLKEDENENINTVIGISKVIPILEAMGNEEPRIYFGVKTDDMTIDAKKEHDITSGIYVSEVLSDSPAFDAGLQSGDVILKIDKQMVLSSSNFNDIITEYQPGTKLTVTVKRSGGTKEKEKEIELKVVLAEKER